MIEFGCGVPNYSVLIGKIVERRGDAGLLFADRWHPRVTSQSLATTTHNVDRNFPVDSGVEISEASRARCR
jgi:hypothetical protein